MAQVYLPPEYNFAYEWLYSHHPVLLIAPSVAATARQITISRNFSQIPQMAQQKSIIDVHSLNLMNITGTGTSILLLSIDELK